MEILLNLPVKLLNIMKDIRMKQLQEQQRSLEEKSAVKAPQPRGQQQPVIPAGGLSDLIDELS